jgi:hypothetical protein
LYALGFFILVKDPRQLVVPHKKSLRQLERCNHSGGAQWNRLYFSAKHVTNTQSGIQIILKAKGVTVSNNACHI